MLNKKFSACVLALSVLVSPVAAQNVKVQTGPAVTASGLGAAGSAPSIQLNDFRLASPLTSGPNLAAPLFPALTAVPVKAAAAVQPQDLAKPVAAVEPVKIQPVAVRALNAVKNTFGSLFSRKGSEGSGPKTGLPSTDNGSSMFDGSRKLLATVLTAAIMCAGGCSKDDVEPTAPGGYPHMDDRPATAAAAADMLNNTFDGSEAYAAKIGFNNWDAEYHLGVPHRNDFDVNSAHHYTAQQGSFEVEQAKLSAMPVDQAVGAKLVYIDAAWVLIADDTPSDYWVSEWRQVSNLYSAAEAQDYLNYWLTSSEAYDAKLAGHTQGIVRLTYPVDPLTLSYNQYWDMATFDTFLEAMLWSQDYLDASQNRGMKIFYSLYDANYTVLYPVESGAMAQKLGVSQQELESAIQTNSKATPLAEGAALHKDGGKERVTVNWKGVFSELKKQAPAPSTQESRAAVKK